MSLSWLPIVNWLLWLLAIAIPVFQLPVRWRRLRARVAARFRRPPPPPVLPEVGPYRSAGARPEGYDEEPWTEHPELDERVRMLAGAGATVDEVMKAVDDWHWSNPHVDAHSVNQRAARSANQRPARHIATPRQRRQPD